MGKFDNLMSSTKSKTDHFILSIGQELEKLSSAIGSGGSATLLTEATYLANETGTNTVSRVDISANASYAIPGNTYTAWQLIIVSGSVTDGTIVYPEGVYTEEAKNNKLINPGCTLNATGAVAYVKLMA